MNPVVHNKSEMAQKFQRHPNDTGSSEVQIAVLSNKIAELSEHLQRHKKDFHSRRGLIKMVNNRRRLLDYLKNTQYQKYLNLIKELGIRK